MISSIASSLRRASACSFRLRSICALFRSICAFIFASNSIVAAWAGIFPVFLFFGLLITISGVWFRPPDEPGVFEPDVDGIVVESISLIGFIEWRLLMYSFIAPKNGHVSASCSSPSRLTPVYGVIIFLYLSTRYSHFFFWHCSPDAPQSSKSAPLAQAILPAPRFPMNQMLFFTRSFISCLTSASFPENLINIINNYSSFD